MKPSYFGKGTNKILFASCLRSLKCVFIVEANDVVMFWRFMTSVLL